MKMVLDHCKKPCQINLAQHWIKTDRDQSKLVMMIYDPPLYFSI